MKEIKNVADFKSIIETGKPVLLDFYANWCGPCRALLPTVEKLAETHAEDFEIVKVNVDTNRELAQQFGVDSVVNNAAVPNEKNEAVINEASSSVVSGLQKMVADGDLSQLATLFQGDNAKDTSNPAVQKLTQQLTGNLSEKLGIDSSAAAGVASSIIPKILASLVGKANLGTHTAITHNCDWVAFVGNEPFTVDVRTGGITTETLTAVGNAATGVYKAYSATNRSAGTTFICSAKCAGWADLTGGDESVLTMYNL